MPDRSVSTLMALLESKPVVSLQQIRDALLGASRATAFRYLHKVPYRRSYNHNGRFYTKHDPAQYDRYGLLAHDDVYFSRDGSLMATICRLVRESLAGRTHRELRELLRVRVQVVLKEAVKQRSIDRERLAGLFLYVHPDKEAKAAQLVRRRSQLEAAEATQAEQQLSDAVVIQVLLVLIRHPGSQPADVVRRLRGHSPPISRAQVDAVFTRFDLGEKGGATTC
jgi:hypothetical protein